MFADIAAFVVLSSLVGMTAALAIGAKSLLALIPLVTILSWIGGALVNNPAIKNVLLNITCIFFLLTMIAVPLLLRFSLI